MKIKFLLLILILIVASAAKAQGTCPSGLPVTGTNCYFVAATGVDSNNGTSESTPWLHAPGMSTATGLASSTTIHAGNGIVLRGGDTWHFGNSGSTPFAGYQTNAWNFTTSGSATNCQINPASALVYTSCIYIGVDQTWFNSSVCGASWCRPMMNGDNPLSTSSPASCSFEDSGHTQTINFSGQYLYIDNLEVLGFCWNITNPDAFIVSINQNDRYTNAYHHGWTMGLTASGCGGCDGDEYWQITTLSTTGFLYSRIDHNVYDGSDSTFGNLFGSFGDASGAIWHTQGEVDHNVINHASNGVKFTPTWMFHHNYLDAMYEPKPGGTHGNIWELNGSTIDWTMSTYGYDNLVLRNNIGETFDVYPGAAASSKKGYLFNNVQVNPDGNAGVNCYLVEGDGVGGPGPFQFFNNTSVSACVMRSGHSTTNSGVYQNNQFLSFSPAILSSFTSLATVTDNGNEIFQTTGVACGSNSPSSNYAPTSGACATVGAGANLSSICSGMDNAEAAADCLNGFNPVTYNQTNHTAVDTAPVARGTTWDAGAYEFNASGGVTTISPTSNNFGSVAVGSSSSNVTFTLTNNSISTVTGITITNTSGNTGDFVNNGTGTCGSTLSASATCTIIYHFHPASTGARSTTLNVADSDSSSPQQATLTGTGISFSPGSVVVTGLKLSTNTVVH